MCMVVLPTYGGTTVMRIALGVVSALMVWLCLPVSHAEARDFELAFASGKSYTVVSNAVVRGDRDYYYFGAGDGQHISIAIMSLEDNAVVELSYRDGGNWYPVDTFEDARAWYGD